MKHFIHYCTDNSSSFINCNKSNRLIRFNYIRYIIKYFKNMKIYSNPERNIESNGIHDDGILYSGNFINIDSDGQSIDIPIQNGSTVCYFNLETHKFEQYTDLTGDVYTLNDGDYQLITRLWDNQFSNEDIDKINNEPEILVKWVLGEDVLSIQKSENDYVFHCNDHLNMGQYLTPIGSNADSDCVVVIHIEDDNTDITITTIDADTYTIDWGDGTIDSDTDTHTYTVAGDYTIKIIGDTVTHLSFKNLPITKVKNLGLKHYTSLSEMFRNTLIEDVNIGIVDTIDISTMYSIFRDCVNLNTTPDVRKINTSNMTNLSYCFCNLKNITEPPNVSNWDTVKATTLAGLFSHLEGITEPPNVSNFNTSNVTNMYDTFSHLKNITTPPDVSNWDTSSLKYINYTFSGLKSITEPPNVSNWDVSNVTTTKSLFSDCISLESLPDMSNWDTSKLEIIDYMLYNLTAISEIGDVGIQDWDISSLTSAVNFAKYSKFSTNIYDQILINWEAQDPSNEVEIHFGDSKYTSGGDAEDARQSLIDNYGWTIYDGGTA